MRRWWDQRGVSMVEMVVAVGLVGSIVAVMGPLMTSSFRSGRVVQNESQALDELRTSVARIERELRSADCIDVPDPGAAGSTLTFRTLADPAGPYTVSYSIEAGRLVRDVGGVKQYFGEGVVASGSEFARAVQSGQRDSVGVTLDVRFEDGHNPRRVATSVAGRNAWVQCP